MRGLSACRRNGAPLASDTSRGCVTKRARFGRVWFGTSWAGRSPARVRHEKGPVWACLVWHLTGWPVTGEGASRKGPGLGPFGSVPHGLPGHGRGCVTKNGPVWACLVRHLTGWPVTGEGASRKGPGLGPFGSVPHGLAGHGRRCVTKRARFGPVWFGTSRAGRSEPFACCARRPGPPRRCSARAARCERANCQRSPRTEAVRPPVGIRRPTVRR